MIVAHKFLSLSLKLVVVLFPLNVNKDKNALHFDFLMSNTNVQFYFL